MINQETADRWWAAVQKNAAGLTIYAVADMATALGLRLVVSGIAQAGEAGTAETPKSGSVHEHAVAESDVPKS